MIAHATIWEFVHILVELKSVAMCLTTHSNFFKACLFFTAKFKLNLLVFFLERINYEVRCLLFRTANNREVSYFVVLLLLNKVLK